MSKELDQQYLMKYLLERTTLNRNNRNKAAENFKHIP